MFIIDDSTPTDVTHDPRYQRGYEERDYKLFPKEMFAAPSEIPLIPRSEWDARIKEQEEQKSSLEHLWARTGDDVLDQNGQGYCWSYSVTMTVMMQRLFSNMKHVRLSAHGPACKIKGFKDQGGWCGLGARFARETGIPSVASWPEKSMSRLHDTKATWEDAAKYKITQDFVDLTADVWGQNLAFDQVVSCLLQNRACALDFNWWGHSVCGARVISPERGVYGIRGPNSWTKAWGDNGWFTIIGNKAKPDGAVCTVSSTLTMAA